MADYPYDGQLIADPVTFQRATNAQITVYDAADTSNTTKLVLKDTTGLPLPNPLTSTADAFTVPFYAPSQDIKLVGAGLTVFVSSAKGMRDAAAAAAGAAQTAASEAITAAGNAISTASVNGSGELVLQKASGATVTAGSVKGPKGDRGDKGLDGANVLPTAEAIAQAVTTDGPAKTALSATYLPKWKAATAYLAGAQVVAPTGETVTAKVDFTSGATFSAANWNFPAAATAPGVTFVTLNSVGQSVTIPTNSVVGLALVQGTGGSKTASWPAGIRWDGGTAPTLSTAAGAVDVVTLVADGSGGWLGKLDGRYSGPIDTTAPSALTGLTAGTATSSAIPLSWTAATDNVAVTGYEYSTNGGSSWTSTGSTGTSYTVTGLSSGTSYTIQVRAFDAAGNRGTAASVTKSTTGAVTPYDTAVAADSPVHWLKFDGNVTDSGSRAQTFTATSLTYGASLGDTTQAGVFDGVASKVVGPNTTGTGILGATTATVEALVKTSAATFGTVMAQNQALTFAVNASRQVEMTYYVAGVAKKVTTTTTLTVGTTYHVAGVFDGSNVIVYINGVASGAIAASGALQSTAATLNIGMFSSNLWFTGSIDGVAVYATALTAGRILAHAQGAGLA